MSWLTRLSALTNRQSALLAIAAIAVPALVGGAVVFWIERDDQRIRRDNEYLRREIVAVEGQIRELEELEELRSQLLARMQVIGALSEGQTAAREMLLTLSRIPEGIQLTRVEFDSESGRLEGRTLSASLISGMNQLLTRSELSWSASVSRMAKTDQNLLSFAVDLSRTNAIGEAQ